jgi:general secretion pathway protein M
MNADARRALSAFGIVAVVVVALGAALSSALALRDARAEVARLDEQAQDLAARERRLPPPAPGDKAASPFFEARTITLAGAALQQRLEAAVNAAHGRLVSSRVEVAPGGDARAISLAAELTIPEPDMQTLLYDLETGRPYLFVESMEARAPEASSDANAGAMRVALTVSGQWNETK